jgi:hypothetical protein
MQRLKNLLSPLSAAKSLRQEQPPGSIKLKNAPKIRARQEKTGFGTEPRDSSEPVTRSIRPSAEITFGSHAQGPQLRSQRRAGNTEQLTRLDLVAFNMAKDHVEYGPVHLQA